MFSFFDSIIDKKYIVIYFYLDMNISYTMGLCMVSLGEATGCLTKHIETAQSNASKFLLDFYIIYFL